MPSCRIIFVREGPMLLFDLINLFLTARKIFTTLFARVQTAYMFQEKDVSA